MKKRVLLMMIIGIALTVYTMISGADPAITDSGIFGNSLTWTLDDTGLLKITGKGSMPDFSVTYANGHYIPNTPWGTEIRMVEIDEGITSISRNSFRSNSDLESVLIPKTVTTIGAYAFDGCESLLDISLPSNINTIQESAFSHSGIRTIKIPNGVTQIDRLVFRYCGNLETVSIPKSVAQIGNCAFGDCPKLREIKVDANNENYSSVNGILYDKEKTNLLQCPGGLTHVEFSSDTVSIGFAAFSGCTELMAVSIPEGVESIGEQAFYNCSMLTNVLLPDSVTAIGGWAFSGCQNLREINLPNQVSDIGGYAFNNCYALNHISLPNSIKTIGDYAFYCCSTLEGIIIPEGVTKIGEYTFCNCQNLKVIVLPHSLKTIEKFAFGWCYSLTDIVIPENVDSIDWGGFYYCDNLARMVFLQDSDIVIDFGSGIFGNEVKRSVYCFEFSSAEQWANENKFDVFLLDHSSYPEITKILLEKDFRLACGKSYTLNAHIYPRGQNIVWGSSDSSIVSVNEHGVVTALTSGVATITASVGNLSASVNISAYIPVDSFNLNTSEEWVVAKDTFKLSVADRSPANATLYIVWSSSDQNIATVEKGLVTTKKPGDVLITAYETTGIQKKAIIHSCYAVTAIEFDQPVYYCSLNQNVQVTANVTMRSQSCINHLVSFTSSDDSIATVDNTGTVHGLSHGTVTITAKSGPEDVIATTEVQIHDWSNPTYEWGPDDSQVTVTRTCLLDDHHVETETVNTYRELIKAPTETIEGVYQIVSMPFADRIFTVQKKTNLKIPTLGSMSVMHLPDGLEKIEAGAFENIATEAVFIPNNRITIEPGAFVNCRKLLYLRIPTGTEVSDDIFVGCPNVVIDGE